MLQLLNSASSAVMAQFVNGGYMGGQDGSGLMSTWQQTFLPELNSLIADANSYASPARIQQAMGAAESGVAQTFNQARDNALHDLTSFGVDPSSGRYAQLDAASRMQEAAAQAGAGNIAEQQTEAIGRSLRSEAIQATAQLPSQAAAMIGADAQMLQVRTNQMLGQLNAQVAQENADTARAAEISNSAVAKQNANTAQMAAESNAANKGKSGDDFGGPGSGSAADDARLAQMGQQDAAEEAANTAQANARTAAGASQANAQTAANASQANAKTAADAKTGGGSGNGNGKTPGTYDNLNAEKPTSGGGGGGGGSSGGGGGGGGPSYSPPEGYGGVDSSYPVDNSVAGTDPNMGLGNVPDDTNLVPDTDPSMSTGQNDQQPDWMTSDLNNPSALPDDSTQLAGDVPTPDTPDENPVDDGSDQQPDAGAIPDLTADQSTPTPDNTDDSGYTGDSANTDASTLMSDASQDQGTDTGDTNDNSTQDTGLDSYDNNYTGDSGDSGGSDTGSDNGGDTSGDSGDFGDSGGDGGDDSSDDSFAQGGEVVSPAAKVHARTGAIPASMSPSGGRATDDVPARLNGTGEQIRLNQGEFIMPKDVVAWNGEGHYQKHIQKSRKEMQGASAKPTMKPAIPMGGMQ